MSVQWLGLLSLCYSEIFRDRWLKNTKTENLKMIWLIHLSLFFSTYEKLVGRMTLFPELWLVIVWDVKFTCSGEPHSICYHGDLSWLKVANFVAHLYPLMSLCGLGPFTQKLWIMWSHIMFSLIIYNQWRSRLEQITSAVCDPVQTGLCEQEGTRLCLLQRTQRHRRTRPARTK